MIETPGGINPTELYCSLKYTILLHILVSFFGTRTHKEAFINYVKRLGGREGRAKSHSISNGGGGSA